VRKIAQKTEDFGLILLRPVFFADSGLKTQIGLLNSPELWLLSAAILGVEIVGQYFGNCDAVNHHNYSLLHQSLKVVPLMALL